MKCLATLGFGLALCGIFIACGDDSGTSSSEENNPEFESNSSVDENLSSSQNLITSSSTGTSTEKLSSAKLENSSSSSVFNKSSSSVSSGSNVNSSSSENVSSSSDESSSSSNSVSSGSNSAGGLNSSSSSSSLVDPSTVVKGSMTDSRDSRTYKTVTIGTQTWMAENLNYAYNHPTATLDSSSVCFENNLESCAQFGRLYLWSAAMDSAAVFGTAGRHCGYADEGNWDHVCERPNLKTRGVCPEGWHIPSRDEWNVLFSAVGGRSTAAPKLKATDGWAEDGNGTDDYGFSAVPTGFWEDPDRFGGAGESTKFWASTEDNGYNAWDAQLGFFSFVVEFWPGSKKYGAAVRCVKD